jgi:hypothetical protein
LEQRVGELNDPFSYLFLPEAFSSLKFQIDVNYNHKITAFHLSREDSVMSDSPHICQIYVEAIEGAECLMPFVEARQISVVLLTRVGPLG